MFDLSTGVPLTFGFAAALAATGLGDLDLSGVVSVDELAGGIKVSDDVEVGEVISGGDGIDTLVIYGTTNLAILANQFNAAGDIEHAVLKSHAIMTVGQVNSLQTINGNGADSELTIVGSLAVQMWLM
ncbi:MAG: hypothetical protein L3K52_18025 [Candidatus Thiothrix sulfatifontis]|nr:MAG: hypothetical protein L3K52_18025 [Candidatus Thiothrix sulfatifontis]